MVAINFLLFMKVLAGHRSLTFTSGSLCRFVSSQGLDDDFLALWPRWHNVGLATLTKDFLTKVRGFFLQISEERLATACLWLQLIGGLERHRFWPSLFAI